MVYFTAIYRTQSILENNKSTSAVNYGTILKIKHWAQYKFRWFCNVKLKIY